MCRSPPRIGRNQSQVADLSGFDQTWPNATNAGLISTKSSSAFAKLGYESTKSGSDLERQLDRQVYCATACTWSCMFLFEVGRFGHAKLANCWTMLTRCEAASNHAGRFWQNSGRNEGASRLCGMPTTCRRLWSLFVVDSTNIGRNRPIMMSTIVVESAQISRFCHVERKGSSVQVFSCRVLGRREFRYLPRTHMGRANVLVNAAPRSNITNPLPREMPPSVSARQSGPLNLYTMLLNKRSRIIIIESVPKSGTLRPHPHHPIAWEGMQRRFA